MKGNIYIYEIEKKTQTHQYIYICMLLVLLNPFK